MKKSMIGLIRRQDWHYTAARDWRDGLLLGNGNIGALAYAPSHLEWVLNKVDIFDPTVENGLMEKMTPHAEFLRRVGAMNPKNTLFLNALEDAPLSRRPGIRNTISAAVLRLRFWQGIGWAAPPAPLVSQHLSLYDGVLEESMDAHLFHPKIKMFIPRDTGLFCLRISESAAPSREHIFELVRPANEILPEPVWKIGESTVCFHQQLPGGKSSYAVAARFVPRNGGTVGAEQHLCNASERLQSGDVDFFLAIRSSYESADPAGDALRETERAAAEGFDSLEEKHQKWWHAYWDNAYADFGSGNGKIQQYFTFGLYELASSFGKAPMPGLNGLSYGPLNEQTPGVSYQGYTHDQNAQIPAMPFFPLNRVQFVRTLADTYLNCRKNLRRHTRRLFNCEGIFLPLTMNQLGQEYPGRSYRYTLNGSAYTGMILSMAWRYSHDPVLLQEKIYPLLREFVMFYTGIMKKGEDGVYHLDWSVPPEIFTLTRDESSTLAMLKVCLETLTETAVILRRDRKRLSLWQDILAHYPQIGKTPSGAFWCGPDVPADHYFYGGHLLYPFFPAGICGDRGAAAKTLALIRAEAVERSFADRHGQWHLNHEWSMFLYTAAQIRLGDREEGQRGIERFLELFAKENGLFSHDPILIADPMETEANAELNAGRLRNSRRWCDGEILDAANPEVPHPACATSNPDAKRLAPAVLEGSSSFLFLAAETLLQSHGGVISLFPCVPQGFTGSFERFLAEGAFEVSAAMKKGKVTRVKIRSLHGGVFQLLWPGASKRLKKELAANEVFEYKPTVK
jgi:predicted RNase H-like HicB family nuclease